MWTKLETWGKTGEGGIQGLARWGDQAEETMEITGVGTRSPDVLSKDL